MSKGGRPTKYKEEYCEEIIEFFDADPYYDKELPHYGKEGELKWMDYKRMANPLPTLRNFAKKIGVSYTTVYNWSSVHEEFLNAFIHAKELRKWFLIENGLNGCYNAAFAIFTAKNITDMKDEFNFKEELTIDNLDNATDEQLRAFIKTAQKEREDRKKQVSDRSRGDGEVVAKKTGEEESK